MGEDGRVAEGAYPIGVLQVEGHRLVREGLRLLLEREPGMAVAGEAADGETGLHLVALSWPISPSVLRYAAGSYAWCSPPRIGTARTLPGSVAPDTHPSRPSGTRCPRP